jgi:Tol biopolymer transport system component
MDGSTRTVRHGSRHWPLLFATIFTASISLYGAPATASEVELASVRAGSDVAAGGRGPAVSDDGRFVAFLSRYGNVVPGDTSSRDDLFVRDTVAGTTERVSVGHDGSEANCDSFAQSISADGRFIAFMSCATNLVRGQPDVWGWHVFVRDRVQKTTEMTVVGIYPRISASGRYIAYLSAEDSPDVYFIDRSTGLTELISANASGLPVKGCANPSLSRDGRFVAFWSAAADLVPDDTNLVPDIFVRDRLSGLIERVDVASNGDQANDSASGRPSLSDDGRYVAFRSVASNLVPGDVAYSEDIFVRDRLSGTTERISVTSTGEPQGSVDRSSPVISAGGRFVLFESYVPTANFRGDVFMRDRQRGTTVRVTPARTNRGSQDATMSADARFVAVETKASNLSLEDVNGLPDVYLIDRQPATSSTQYSLKPVSVDYGQQALGTNTTRRLWLANLTGAALPILSIELRGVDRSQYRISWKSCGAVVPADAGCAIGVTFRPTSAGVKFAAVKVVAGEYVIRTSALKGTGVASGSE